MKILTALSLLACLAAAPLAARAQDGLDPAKAAAFDSRVFGGPVGQKASACFVRRYDARHLAQHPKQKIAAMKLLVTAETPPDEPTNYAYHLGVQFRNRPGNFDAGSSCGHLLSAGGRGEITFTCDGDCGSGGLQIAISTDNKSAVVRLDAITIWDRKHPDADVTSLQGRAEDKVFRVDRVDTGECAELLSHDEEQASLQ